ncbi:MAG: hypothetical protein KF685_06875 [Acidobacteria bacterium]|nr:hypothetical protein [Acidobacteriota bacterium]
MFGKQIFEIAVYRKKPETLDTDLDKTYVNSIRRIAPYYDLTNFKKHPSYDYFRRRQGHPHPYNQVVGWIVLWVRNDSILGEYYATEGKRITHACKKLPLQWKGKAFDVYIFDEDTNVTIPAKIREEILLLTKSGTFSKRFIDLIAFDNLVSYVDWRKMVDEAIYPF